MHVRIFLGERWFLLKKRAFQTKTMLKNTELGRKIDVKPETF